MIFMFIYIFINSFKKNCNNEKKNFFEIYNYIYNILLQYNIIIVIIDKNCNFIMCKFMYI